MQRWLLVMALLAVCVVLTVNAQDEAAKPATEPATGGQAVEGEAAEGEEEAPKPVVYEEATKTKVSYGIGFNMGTDIIRDFQQNQVRLGEDISKEELLKGITDALEEKEAVVPQEEVNTAFEKFTAYLTVKRKERIEELAATNKAEGEAFLAENKGKEGVTTTESGLQYIVLEPGEGETPTVESVVVVHYTGTFTDGEKFESSKDFGRPATFQLGGVIPGWVEGLQKIKPGGKIKLFIPSELAYGESGGRSMEPNKTLVFEVELLEVREAPQQPQLPIPPQQPQPQE